MSDTVGVVQVILSGKDQARASSREHGNQSPGVHDVISYAEISEAGGVD
jgi:hypothetical protein